MDDRRQHQRHRVHLSIRFGKAKEFIQQYAENLSRGGLFAPGDYALAEGQEIAVEIDLPGLGGFSVRAKVVHQVTPDAAAQSGRHAGLGLEIVQEPEGFRDALTSYLKRLAGRRKAVVLVRDARCAKVLQDAGYQVRKVPSPIQVGPILQTTVAHVIGVVIPPEDLDDYAAATAAVGMGNLAIAMHGPAELDIVLTLLDHNMLAARAGEDAP